MTAVTETPGTPDGAPTAIDGAGDRPFTVRVVDRVGRALSGSGFSRRRFLGRTAIVGAAVALDPLRYVLKPGTAYAQVCGDGASCSSGWTAFCCTVNDGANTCPPGSYVAGWWRIDDSPFCLGAARYVIDCNRSPNASCSCRCADGSCDQRRVCCNNFRYGQCNTQVRGVTEVVCRVVTCTTPWEWDAACSRTVRVDNRTRSHNAPCLPGRDATPIAIKYQDLGMTKSILGPPTGSESSGARGGRYRRYRNGTIHWRSNLGAHAVHGVMNDAHRDLGGASGVLGYPRMDVRALGDGIGLQIRFENGSLYQRSRSATPIAVHEPIDTRYRERGGPTGSLGYPTSTARRSDGSTVAVFEEGVLSAVAGFPLVAANRAGYSSANRSSAPAADRVGWPTGTEQGGSGGRYQRYERGTVSQATSGWVGIGRDLADRFLRAGGPGGSSGRPTGAPRAVAGGRVLELQRAAIYTSEATGTQLLNGAVLAAYRAEGGPSGSLGFPTSEVVRAPNGQQRASFVRGAIVIEPNGSVSVLTPRGTSSPGDLSRSTPSGSGARRRRTPSDLS